MQGAVCCQNEYIVFRDFHECAVGKLESDKLRATGGLDAGYVDFLQVGDHPVQDIKQRFCRAVGLTEEVAYLGEYIWQGDGLFEIL